MNFAYNKVSRVESAEPRQKNSVERRPMNLR
jgi:hypothetical protein